MPTMWAGHPLGTAEPSRAETKIKSLNIYFKYIFKDVDTCHARRARQVGIPGMAGTAITAMPTGVADLGGAELGYPAISASRNAKIEINIGEADLDFTDRARNAGLGA
jgi:hypothetical protein